jgi:hypothetical protein
MQAKQAEAKKKSKNKKKDSATKGGHKGSDKEAVDVSGRHVG